MRPTPSSAGRSVAARRLGIGLLLVGARDVIEGALARHPGADAVDVRILDAPDRIEMAESASAALRRKPRPRFASRPRRCGTERRRRSSAPVTPARRSWPRTRRSAGCRASTGRRSPRSSRPGGTRRCCSTRARPSSAGRSTSSSSPSWDRRTRASRSGVESPRVGLLSVGEEESKGNELTREAHQLLKSAPVRFVGNVEGRDVYAGEADVIVCDGFTGNVTLKISEGLVETVERLLHEELSATVGTRVGYLLSREAFRRFRKRVDYAEYGGAPLIGLDGLCVIGHGRSSAKAVRNAVMMTAKLVNEQLSIAHAGRGGRGSDQNAPTVEGASRDASRAANQHDRIRLSRARVRRRSAWARPWPRRFPICRADVRRGRRGARRVAERALLRRSRVAARCSPRTRSRRSSPSASRPARLVASQRCRRRVRGRAQPRRVLGARRRRHAVLRGRAADRPAPRAVHAGGGAGRRGRDGGDSRG